MYVGLYVKYPLFCQTVTKLDWLRAGRSGNRILVEVRFFAHFQTCPEAHPASCAVGNGSFPGVKWPERGADHPPLLAPRSRKSRDIRLPSSGLSGLLWVTFTFTYNETLLFWIDFRKILIQNFMKIRPVETELFHADRGVDRRRDGQT
jgi:hypothetical protein